MDDPRWERGMPVLDRQASDRQASDRQASDRSVSDPRRRHEGSPRTLPELEPTPLQPYYINLSAIGLVAGAIAITALELGAPLSSWLLKVCVIVGAPPLLLATADASLRIWRSARAWMPINPGNAWFRLTWLVPAFVLLATIVAVGSIVLQA
jgi:hypothetical protein